MKKLVAAMLAAAIIAVGVLASAQVTTTHTMSGTVVTATDQDLIVDTPSGRMALKLDSVLNRVRYNDLKPGTSIEFTHRTNDQGVLMLTDVKMVDAAAYTDPTRTTTTTTTNVSDDRDTASRLPDTASPIALVMIGGVAALALGIALRRSSGSIAGSRRS